jgi:aubergine-like protein
MNFSHYNSWVSFQRGDAECITTAFDLMKKALEAFKKNNNVYPANVIVYRDGVGDSQLNTFVKQEIEDYKKAFKALGKPDIKVTVIVVQKNVNVRFFHECEKYKSRDAKCRAEGRKCDGNQFHSPCPGTVVDRDVCNPLYYDFYLIPTKAPKGACASPTRFVVVRDDIKFSADDLQSLTNQLTCSYFNWPGPIRVPSPCMYAHKLSYLFGVYLNGKPNDKLTKQLHYL